MGDGTFDVEDLDATLKGEVDFGPLGGESEDREGGFVPASFNLSFLIFFLL
jgi:hypothetical protein